MVAHNCREGFTAGDLRF